MSSSASPADFGVSPTNGFLPVTAPLRRLPAPFDEWEDLALQLPKYLAGDGIRRVIEGMPPFPVEKLTTGREIERAMSALSYLGHAYVWTGAEPARRLPAVLGVPWHKLSLKLGRPPVLSYSSYAIHNWRLLDESRPIETGNIALIQNFFGGIDEEWFILIHVDIEKKAGPIMVRLFDIQQAAADKDADRATALLNEIMPSMVALNESLARMLEFCDPYVYYHRVRPYIHGWKGHPDLPEGLIYEGVEEFGGKPQQFRGETGAQSSIVPALDGLFGVEHVRDTLKEYLMEMRTYMEPAFRKFIEAVEAGPSLRAFVLEANHGPLTEAYDEGLHQLEKFRTKHYEFAASYIYKQGQTDAKNPHAVGTGGTPFMPYLRKHRDETAEHLVSKA